MSITAASAADWPPVMGDLILGVQATGGTGATTNVFFNLGPAHALRDSPSPGLLVNLDAELTAAFGAGWSGRDDLYFGLIANRNSSPPEGMGFLGSRPPENGDPSRTVYASRGTSVAGSAPAWSGYSVSALAFAATGHSGQIEAIDNLIANANEVATLSQGTNPVEWFNSWSEHNPTPGAAYRTFAGGIQANITASGAIVDLFRIVSTSGVGSYVTSITLSATGDVTATAAGPPVSYYTVTPTATNGSIAGAGPDVVYAGGSAAKLTAIPAPGYGFSEWSGDASGTENPLSLTMDSNKSVTAIFAALPTITSPTATGITGTDAVLGGNVTSVGGSTVTERGIVYSLRTENVNPLIDGTGVTKVAATGTTGVFTLPVTGLTGDTTYVFKAYAMSSLGNVYTPATNFTTETEVELTGGIGDIIGRDIAAGETQSFSFTIAAGTQAKITALNAGSLSGKLYDNLGNEVASESGNFVMDQLLGAGTYRLEMTAGATPETFSLNFDTTNRVVASPRVTVPGRVISKKAKRVNVNATITNSSVLADTFRVSARKGNKLFKVKYTGPTGNITGTITTGRYVTPSLHASAAPVSIRAVVTPIKKKIVKKRPGQKPKFLKKTFRSTISATASTNPASSAVGQFQVRTR